MANIERLRQVLNLIKENPQHWDQTDWHCGTSHCFAGFADCLAANVDFKQHVKDISGYNRPWISFANNRKGIKQVAQEWLELNSIQAALLFNGENDIETLEMLIDKIERDEI